MKIKRRLALFVACLAVSSLAVPVFANTQSVPRVLTSAVLDNGLEGFFIDVDALLKYGTYSEDMKTVTYDGNTFSVEDMIKAQNELNKQSLDIQTKSIKYNKLRSQLFYSKGKQHVLARITLNPGQSGTIGQGCSFDYTVEVSRGVSAEVFEASVSDSYSKSYQVTTSHEVKNTTSKMQTHVLGSVFMVHEYEVRDTGILGNKDEYVGIAQFYEPYSVYTYVE